MKSRVVMAIVFSLIVVGVAGVLRVTNGRKAATLTAVQGVEVIDPIADKSMAEKVSIASSAQPLSPTDVVSRNLFSDYVNLKSSGQDTPENIERLASVYSAQMLAKNMGVRITAQDIHSVSDTQANLTAYNQAMTTARARYEAQADATSDGQDYSDVTDPRFKQLMQSLSSIYEGAVKELKVMPVPASLVTNHVQIVNNYLSSSEATIALGNIDGDPMAAFAALGAQAKNSAEEEGLFDNIRLVMIQKGFPSNP